MRLSRVESQIGEQGLRLPPKEDDRTSVVALGGEGAEERGTEHPLTGSPGYSTVTDFARLRGWSTSRPRRTAT